MLKWIGVALWTMVRVMGLSALAGAVVGWLLAGVEGAIGGATLAGAFGMTAGVLSLLAYFLRDDPRDENDLRWHRGGQSDD